MHHCVCSRSFSNCTGVVADLDASCIYFLVQCILSHTHSCNTHTVAAPAHCCCLPSCQPHCPMRCFALVPALMLPCCLQVEVDTNDVCTVSSCAVAVQACSDPPQTVSGHVPELDLPAASVHSITTLKYSPFHPAASPDSRSTSGSSMTERCRHIQDLS